jgi:hypothetical protein
MSGVIRLIFWRDVGSVSGEDDFFSVARTMPFVAMTRLACLAACRLVQVRRTLDAECCHSLVNRIEGILYLHQLAAKRPVSELIV